MANKLVTKAKSVLAKKIPPPAPSPTGAGVEPGMRVAPRKIAGMEEDRYHRAESALDAMTRAENHRADKKLMQDVHKVAQHKAAAMERALGGGVRAGGKKR